MVSVTGRAVGGQSKPHWGLKREGEIRDTCGYQEEKCSEKRPDAKALRMECPQCVRHTTSRRLALWVHWVRRGRRWGQSAKGGQSMEALSSYSPTGSSLLPILFTWGTKKVNNLSKVTNKMLGQIIKWFENMTPKPLTHLLLWGRYGPSPFCLNLGACLWPL